jgi:uncharacterized membrane protein YcgQ (UPF0703/DUF1980 family)
MKRISLLLIVCLISALTGCQGNAPENQNADNGNNASAVESQNFDNSGVPAVGGQNSTTTSQSTTAPVVEPQKPSVNGDVIEITENLFVAQLNDIYLNQDDYIGKKIKYEGMFTQYHWDETNMTYYLVYRKSPGCCGTDGQAGFEVVWPEDSYKTYPTENDWCEVVGTLATYDDGGQSYLHIVLSSLTVLKKRGAEFVSQ